LIETDNKESPTSTSSISTHTETYWTTMQALKIYQSFLHCQLLLFHFFMCHPLSPNNTLL